MFKGVLLALANVFVIAVMIAVAETSAAAVVLVGVYGTLPGVIVGGLCGALASAFPTQHVVLRLAIIMLPAAALVTTLAAAFGMQQYIAMANISTLACCLVLERWTRVVQRDEVDQMPTARVA